MSAWAYITGPRWLTSDTIEYADAGIVAGTLNRRFRKADTRQTRVESANAAYAPNMSRLELRRPDISPMYAPLHGLPPALFTVGSADHTLDDNLLMAQRWAAWGNEVELAVYPDCPHAFLGHSTELANRAAARIDAFIERCVGEVASARSDSS